MKRQILTLVMALVAMLSVTAQKLVIKLENGEELTYETWQLDSLYFTASDQLQSPATAEPVDLGFAKWASFNLGATSPTDAGWLVGWGDVTGTNHSTRLKFFPAETYTKDIYETAYDIVKSRWQDDWRLPVADDIQKLKDNCTWEQTVIEEVPGWKVTSKIEGYTDKWIFLPFTGYRKGAEVADADAKGLYWSGSIGDDNTKAKALLLTAEDSLIVDSTRSLGFAIRPIYGKFVHPLSFSSFVEDISQRTYQSARVVATVQGNMAGVDKIYICFGLETQTLNPLSETGALNKREQAIQGGNTEFEFNISNLDGNTKYKAIAFMYRDETPIFSDTLHFQTYAKFPVAEAVDLGLSVCWASWNMGEVNASGIDHLYGWGDGDGDLTSTNDNLYAPLLNYSSTSIAGDQDYDIATKQWGNGWRLPTKAEFDELYDERKITVSEDIMGGIYGYRYTSKADATKSIFIPYCGITVGTTVMERNGSAFYWSANGAWNSTEGWKPSCCLLLPSKASWKTYPKHYLMGIRPVKVKSGSSTTGSDSGNTGNTGGSDSGNGNTGGSDTGNTGNDSGNTGNEGGDSGQTISTQPGTAVDLGLSVKWANYNLGASSETQMGGYYAWADLEARTNFTRSTYQYYDAETNTYSKFAEGNISGNTLYDPAANTWRNNWRMPTSNEMKELYDNCTWTWTQRNGVDGYLVTSKNNGNSIFLPACGTYTVINVSTGCELYQYGAAGYYWSGNVYKTTYETTWAEAQLLLFISTSISPTTRTMRYTGCCIRPVKP